MLAALDALQMMALCIALGVWTVAGLGIWRIVSLGKNQKHLL